MQQATSRQRWVSYGIEILLIRANSEAELKKKLLKAGCHQEDLDYVISELRDLRYIDDIAFSTQLIYEGIRKGWSQKKIRHYLYTKGVANDAVRIAFEDIEDIDVLECEVDNALRCCIKFFSQNRFENTYKMKQKILSKLQMRGFGMDVALRAYDLFIKELNLNGEYDEFEY